jgi:hypothetical protein
MAAVVCRQHAGRDAASARKRSKQTPTMSNESPRPPRRHITIEDLGLTPEEMEIYARGCRFLYGDPESENDDTEETEETGGLEK